VKVESEFAAMSTVIGASAYGVRTFTATSSQGLALMHELLFAASGMRMPIVMAVANRALSAPINIWNDWQDTISERDAGWIQLYCETNQEAFDTTLQAYKISENEKILLPSMVCLDGFYLTHTTEPVDIPEKIDNYLPEYKPKHAYLDPEKPMTIGSFAYPEVYMEFRRQQEDAMQESLRVIEETDREFGKKFGRKYGLLEKVEGGEDCILTMGSLAGNARIAAKKAGVSLIKLKCMRPFPKEQLIKSLDDVERLIVIEKSASPGLGGVLASEIRDVLYETTDKPDVHGFICGLGGRDVTVKDIEAMAKKVKTGKAQANEWWMGQ
jgi:pyruvate ferredoxin oxidoreductase alpha subunit